MVANRSSFRNVLGRKARCGDTSRMSMSCAVNPDMKMIGRLGRSWRPFVGPRDAASSA